MSVLQRIGVLVGVVSAALVVMLVVQGTTQKVKTQVVDPGGPGFSTANEPTFQTPDEPRFVPGEILVKPRASVPERALENLNRQNNARVVERLPGIGVSVVDLPADLPVQAAVRRYESSQDVQYAEPNFLLYPEAEPNDPAYDKLYGLNNTGQTGGTRDADIDAPEAWNTITGSEATVVAVIDTGVQTGHPDLQSNLWTNPGEIPGNGKDEGNENNLADDVHGWDFCHGDKSVYDSATDDSHGTHVAGTIAAQEDNAAGITGVSWDAQIMSVKFLDESVPDTTKSDCNKTSGAVKAIDYAIDNGAKISNNSWGGGHTETLADAIQKADDAGQLFVASAGNDGENNDVTDNYPADYPNDNIISVAATNDQDALAGFSNFGAQSVDLGAPGVGIYSTVPVGRYASYSGTSMAAPHVAGVAALLKSQNPSYSDEEIRDRILRYAEPKNSLRGKTVTGGRLNADAALKGQQALDSTGPTISAIKPGSTTRDRTPAIGATVSDDRTVLTKAHIELYLDTKKRTTFTYNGATDRLTYIAPRLSYAKHTVKVVATDGTGNRSVKSWSFTVRR